MKITDLNGIELILEYSDDTIFTFDFSTYNRYVDNTKPFYWCRFYVNSYYLGVNEMYTSIYKKIYGKIRRNSIRLNCIDYLYLGKRK